MSPSSVTVYRPNMRHELGFFETWGVMARNIWQARELIWQLFKRDFFAGYKKSFIGIAWVIISPVMSILSWVFLQQAGVLKPGDMGVPYPIYVMVGTSMWGLFLGFFNSASSTLEAGTGLLMQVNYPHEALLFKQIATQLANFLIGLVFTVCLMMAFKVVPSWGVLLLPLVAFPLFLLGTAMGLMMALINVVATDLSRIVRMAMTVLMYTTPIIYAADVPNEYIRTSIQWNPLTYLVCSCRDVIIFGRLYEPSRYYLCAGMAFVLFMISWRLFYVSEDKIVERMV